MKELLEQLKEFHLYTGNDWQYKPQLPHVKRQELRYKLMHEELEEFRMALINRDLIEAADALVDLLYVLLGSVGEFGMGDCFKELFQEVHRSNMSKLCDDMLEVNKTIKFYANHPDPQTRCLADFKPMGTKFAVFRRSDNKTLKSINYSPADLASILSKYMENEKSQ